MVQIETIEFELETHTSKFQINFHKIMNRSLDHNNFYGIVTQTLILLLGYEL